jgi:tRNA nucleotidyltransferase/poly(A) polymerase
MSSSFVFVNPQNALYRDAKVSKLVNKILDKITNIPNYQDHRNDMELLRMIVIMIEHSVNNKDKKVKIDKADIVFQIYNKLFDKITPIEINSIKSNIEYLHNNGHIKKVGFINVIGGLLKDWFKRHIA